MVIDSTSISHPLARVGLIPRLYAECYDVAFILTLQWETRKALITTHPCDVDGKIALDVIAMDRSLDKSALA